MSVAQLLELRVKWGAAKNKCQIRANIKLTNKTGTVNCHVLTEILNMRSESTWTSTCSEDDLTAMLRMYLPNEYLEFTPQCNNDLITILVGSTSQVGVTLYVLYCTHLNTFIYNIYLFINN